MVQGFAQAINAKGARLLFERYSRSIAIQGYSNIKNEISHLKTSRNGTH